MKKSIKFLAVFLLGAVMAAPTALQAAEKAPHRRLRPRQNPANRLPGLMPSFLRFMTSTRSWKTALSKGAII